MMATDFREFVGHIIVALDTFSHSHHANFPNQGPNSNTATGGAQLYSVIKIGDAEIVHRMYQLRSRKIVIIEGAFKIIGRLLGKGALQQAAVMNEGRGDTEELDRLLAEKARLRQEFAEI